MEWTVSHTVAAQAAHLFIGLPADVSVRIYRVAGYRSGRAAISSLVDSCRMNRSGNE